MRVFSIVSLALHSYYLEFFIRALKTLLERARASIQTQTHNERHFSTSLEIIIIYECDGVCVRVFYIKKEVTIIINGAGPVCFGVKFRMIIKLKKRLNRQQLIANENDTISSECR